MHWQPFKICLKYGEHLLYDASFRGTQDVLSVEWEKNIMQIVDMIHSADITAGQFIDRVGVSLGMPFPAGPSMERLAMKHQQLYKVPVANVKMDSVLPARKRRYSVIYKLSVIHQKILLMAFFLYWQVIT